MPEEVLFETDSRQSRAATADYLHAVADKLESGGALSLSAGGQDITLEPPSTVDFEVKVERETGEGADELSVEFELEWREGDQPEDDLDIS